MRTADLVPGDVVWAELSPVIGREQAGRRPVLVVSGEAHLDLVDSMAIVVPVTAVDRGWSNHIRLPDAVLTRPSWAMTEQVRTISRERIVAHAGRVDRRTLHSIRAWIREFLDL